LPGKYLLLPWCETAGAALRWYRDQFFRAGASPGGAPADDLYDRITAEAAEAPPGSEGVLLLPHFAGSGCPDFNPAAKACIYGLTLGHQRKHISRAFLESVAFLLKRNLDLLAGMGVALAGVTCSGGGSRSPLWCQIKADVTGLPMHVCSFPEAPSTGAAMLAAQSLGWSSWEAMCGRPGKSARAFQPDPAAHMVYEEAFRQLLRLDSLLQSGLATETRSPLPRAEAARPGEG
jgi:xylulokinase